MYSCSGRIHINARCVPYPCQANADADPSAGMTICIMASSTAAVFTVDACREWHADAAREGGQGYHQPDV